MVEYLHATVEQRELAETAYKITKNYLTREKIEELENADNGRGIYPMELHYQLANAGYYAMNIPEEYGGLGFSKVTCAIIMEEIAKVDAGFAFAFYNMGAQWHMIKEAHFSKEEKQEIADALICGDARGAFCLTEADAGSDAAAMRTTAVYDKETDEWVINGTKCFVSNAPTATFFTVAAWTDKTQRASKGVTMFYVSRDSEGLSIGKKEHKCGLHLSETSEIILDNVRVPSKNIIGEVGGGFGRALSNITSEGRALGLSFNVGLAQAALDAAIDYAKQRRQFGKRIIDHEGLGFIIADMKARTDASRALMYYVLEAQDKGIAVGMLPNEIKFFISDCTMQTTLDAVQVLGGYGYMKEYPTEKFMRDAKIFQIFSGTNQIQRKNIAKAIAGKDTETVKAQ